MSGRNRIQRGLLFAVFNSRKRLGDPATKSRNFSVEPLGSWGYLHWHSICEVTRWWFRPRPAGGFGPCNGLTMTKNALPKRKNNVTQQIVETLGRRIVSGVMVPVETVLFEQDLIDEFGASRNVVREAVKTLAGKNLVVSARKRGTSVRPAEEWNLLDPQVIDWMIAETSTNEGLIKALSELRQIVEPEAAAWAARRASATQILQLFECYEQMVANVDDAALSVHWDAEYHKVLLAASGNPLLRSLAKAIERLLRSNFSLFTYLNEGYIRNIPDHLWIAEAIRDRDPDLARQRTQTLLSKNESDIEELKTAKGDVDLPPV